VISRGGSSRAAIRRRCRIAGRRRFTRPSMSWPRPVAHLGRASRYGIERDEHRGRWVGHPDGGATDMRHLGWWTPRTRRRAGHLLGKTGPRRRSRLSETLLFCPPPHRGGRWRRPPWSGPSPHDMVPVGRPADVPPEKQQADGALQGSGRDETGPPGGPAPPRDAHRRRGQCRPGHPAYRGDRPVFIRRKWVVHRFAVDVM
jgi:hypothetical protein